MESDRPDLTNVDANGPTGTAKAKRPTRITEETYALLTNMARLRAAYDVLHSVTFLDGDPEEAEFPKITKPLLEMIDRLYARSQEDQEIVDDDEEA